MKDVVLSISPEVEAPTKEELLKLFQREVEEFSNWMAELPDWKYAGPLMKQEKILLVTYLMQKHAGNLDAKKYTEPMQEVK